MSAESKKLFQAPDAPKSVMEALLQRLDKYKGTETKAKQEGEGSKARRMGRIVKVIMILMIIMIIVILIIIIIIIHY